MLVLSVQLLHGAKEKLMPGVNKSAAVCFSLIKNFTGVKYDISLANLIKGQYWYLFYHDFN